VDTSEDSVFAGFVSGNTPLREKSPGLERHHGKYENKKIENKLLGRRLFDQNQKCRHGKK
jgi:hypothetical protein